MHSPDYAKLLQSDNKAKYTQFDSAPTINVEEAQQYGFKHSILDKDKKAKLSLCAKRSELYHLGVAFPLYFQIFKYTIFLVGMMLITSCLYSFISNVTSSDCSIPDSQGEYICNEDGWMATSLGNKRAHGTLMYTHQALVLATVLMMIFIIHGIKAAERFVVLHQDAAENTPSDYSILMEGVTETATEQEIRDYLRSLLNRDFEIKEVIRLYDTFEIVELLRQRTALEAQKAKKSEEELEKLKKKIEAVNNKINELKNLKPIDFVVVVFQWEADAKEIQELSNPTGLNKVIYKLTGSRSRLPLKFQNSHISICEAPDPVDMIWENYSQKTLKHKIKTNIIAAAWIALGVLVIVGIIFFKRFLNKAFPQYVAKNWLLSQVIAILIMWLNTRLAANLKQLIANEKANTYSQYYKDAFIKLLIAQIINTAFSPWFAHFVLKKEHGDAKTYFGDGGILYEMFFIFMTNMYLVPLYSFFDPNYIPIYLKRRSILRHPEKCTLTQAQANVAFDGTQPDLSSKYTGLVRIVIVTAFFAPGLPIVCLFALIQLIVSYWLDKYIIFRRAAHPKIPLGPELPKKMLSMLFYAPLAFASSNLLYTGLLVNESISITAEYSFAWLAFAIALLSVLIPKNFINKNLFQIPEYDVSTVSYDQAKHEFRTTYSKENPFHRPDIAGPPSGELMKQLSKYADQNIPLNALGNDQELNNSFMLKKLSEKSKQRFSAFLGRHVTMTGNDDDEAPKPFLTPGNAIENTVNPSLFGTNRIDMFKTGTNDVSSFRNPDKAENEEEQEKKLPWELVNKTEEEDKTNPQPKLFGMNL